MIIDNTTASRGLDEWRRSREIRLRSGWETGCKTTVLETCLVRVTPMDRRHRRRLLDY